MVDTKAVAVPEAVVEVEVADIGHIDHVEVVDPILVTRDVLYARRITRFPSATKQS